MSKKPKEIAEPTAQTAPPTLFPLVTGSFVVPGASTGVTLTDTAIAELQEDGKIKLGDQYRRNLNDLASAWIMHDRSVQSSRPKQFRNRLIRIGAALENARKASDINASNAPPSDRHLLNWAINVPGASTFYEELQALEQQIKTIKQILTTLQNALPQDFGKRRPHNDTRMILHLAEIYEAAGGKARIYASDYEKSGWADTAFRRFAHKYYAQLPLSRRRRPAGLDNALRDALGRRRQKG